MNQPRILVTGATGLLGPYLIDAATNFGDPVGTARRGTTLTGDLSVSADVSRIVQQVRPDVVIHAAALTDVDRCESCPDEAHAANAMPLEHLAGMLPGHAHLILISTDQVYPDVTGPHVEGSESPVNEYGRSKLSGENAALRYPRSLVLRTSFFGASRTKGRQSLSDFFVDRFRGGGAVTLFSDVLFSPLHISTLCNLVMDAVSAGLTGVFNAGSRDGMSKAEFAKEVANHFSLDASGANTSPSTTIDGRAPRPADLRLDVERIESALGVQMPTLKEEIAKL